jgi:hypothetical protein
MATRTLALLVPVLLLAAAIPACSKEPLAETDVSELTDEDLARKALIAMGAKLPGTTEKWEGSCGKCHSANNQTTFTKWSTQYEDAMKILTDETKSEDARVRSMLRDPARVESGFDPARVGILTAGASLGLAPYVTKEKHPNTYAQNELLSDQAPKGLFAGKSELFKQFKAQMLMPVEGEYDRMSPYEFETTLAWMKKGMPQLKELVPDVGRPTSCTDDFSKLKEHASAMRTKSWEAVNREAQLPMFACSPGADALTCFTQQTTSKQDLFPSSNATLFGKTWAASGDTIRIAQDLGKQNTFYWSRTSADGRFFASGGSGGTSFIVDLQANIVAPGTTRVIHAKANYDPDFFAGNQSFMFQGTNKGGVVCPQSLLTNPKTTEITFDEPGCNKLDQIALYQTVAQARGDNALSDIFVINNKFASDNPSLTGGARDLMLSAGPDAAVRIAVGVSQGTEAGYKVVEVGEVPLPFQGDTMASRSLELLGSRVAGEGKTLGYAISKVTSVKTAQGYTFSIAPQGRICMPGNKANFSFDERFIVTHHYLTREDFASDEEFAPYKAKGASDLYLADFVTGKKTRITRMAPGQFALFPHFRSDGWIMFEVRDASQDNVKVYVSASNSALRAAKAAPTP